MHLRAAKRTRRRGQALVEMALLAPLLIGLLLAGAQVAEIAYGAISLDSASREGARAGALAPNEALKSGGTTWYSAGTTSHTCTANDFTENSTGNPICIAVLNARGYLDSNTFTANPCASTAQACVTISVIGNSGLAALLHPPDRVPDARLMSFPCNSGSQAYVSGTVSGIPSGSTATISDSNGDSSVTASGTGAYTMCVGASHSITSETLTAQVGPVGCGGYSGSTSLAVTKGTTYSGQNFTIAYTSCTSTSTTTSSSTTTTSTTTSTTSTISATPAPAVACTSETVPDTYYIKVTVTYPMPIFVPIVGSILQSQSGLRQLTSSVTDAIEPCSLTLGS